MTGIFIMFLNIFLFLRMKKIYLFWAGAETTLERNTKEEENLEIWQSNTKLVSAHNWWYIGLLFILKVKPQNHPHPSTNDPWIVEVLMLFYLHTILRVTTKEHCLSPMIPKTVSSVSRNVATFRVMTFYTCLIILGRSKIIRYWYP